MRHLVNSNTGVEVIVDEDLANVLGPGWKPKDEPKDEPKGEPKGRK